MQVALASIIPRRYEVCYARVQITTHMQYL